MLKRLKEKSNKGTGEMIGLVVVSLVLILIFVVFVAVIQYSYATDSLINTANVSARAASLCNDMDSAKNKCAEIAANTNTNINLDNIRVKEISNIDAVNEGKDPNRWRTGDMIKITLEGDIDTIIPFLSGTYETTAMVVIEHHTVDMNMDEGTVEGKIVKTLKNHGYSQGAIAAMLSYIWEASRYSPNAYDASLHRAGLCMWSEQRVEKLMEAYPDPDDPALLPQLESQLSFIIDELMDTFMGTDLILLNTGDDIEEAYFAAKYVWEKYGRAAYDPSKARADIDRFYENGTMN